MAGAKVGAAAGTSSELTPERLAKTIEDYLSEHPAAAVLEDGRAVFDMRAARYAVGAQHGRCLLQLWSDECNVVRTVLDVQERAHCLRLATRKMGAAKPQWLELVPTSDRRTPSTRETMRRNYQRLLERVLTRNFPDWKVDGMRSAMDLEHSFGPAYARGRLLKGRAACAVIGVGADESGALVDGVLTLGILWLDYCRRTGDGRRHFGELKVVVPAGAWRTTAERMAWLNREAAEFALYELDERSEELTPVDFRDTGNLDCKLVHAFSAEAALHRCRAGIDRLRGLLPADARDRVELRISGPGAVGFHLHGLEFARVRLGFAVGSFASSQEITFGAGANETPLTEETEEMCRALVRRLFESRRPEGVRTDALYRLQPERWLEATVRAGVAEALPGARGDLLYTQVPALSTGDRGLLDMLTLDRAGRLVVIELKADEDLHLPLQALDYWIRVRALNLDRQGTAGGRALSAFERQGYFGGAEVSPLPPRLLLAAPALRIHPANEIVLRYLSPEVEWELMAVCEQWREELKVVFRKHSGTTCGGADATCGGADAR